MPYRSREIHIQPRTPVHSPYGLPRAPSSAGGVRAQNIETAPAGAVVSRPPKVLNRPGLRSAEPPRLSIGGDPKAAERHPPGWSLLVPPRGMGRSVPGSRFRRTLGFQAHRRSRPKSGRSGGTAAQRLKPMRAPTANHPAVRALAPRRLHDRRSRTDPLDSPLPGTTRSDHRDHHFRQRRAPRDSDAGGVAPKFCDRPGSAFIGSSCLNRSASARAAISRRPATAPARRIGDRSVPAVPPICLTIDPIARAR